MKQPAYQIRTATANYCYFDFAVAVANLLPGSTLWDLADGQYSQLVEIK